MAPIAPLKTHKQKELDRINKLRNNRHKSDPRQLRKQLRRQINRCKKLISEQITITTAMKKETDELKLLNLQSALMDNSKTNNIVNLEILQLNSKLADTQLSFVDTPIKDFNKAPELISIPQLTEQQLNTLHLAIDDVNWTNGIITNADLQCLRSIDKTKQITESWLTASVVSAYLQLLLKQVDDVYTLDPQIASNVQQQQLNTSRKSPIYYPNPNRTKLLKKRLILFPTLVNAHWTLVYVDMNNKIVRHIDSLNEPNQKFTDNVKLYLNARKTLESDDQEKLTGLQTILEPLPPVQRQQNAIDCGVYLLMIARSVIFNTQFSLTNSHMDQIRRLISYELISNSLLEFK